VKSLINRIDQIAFPRYFGQVEGVQGLLIEVSGLVHSLAVGDRCQIVLRNRKIICEVVGLRKGMAQMMPFMAIDGISLGSPVELIESNPVLYPHSQWLGRVINAFGEPIDGKGPLPVGDKAYSIRSSPPSAHGRQRVQGKLDLGVKAMNVFLTLCRGQRMGIFAGSGIGKSTLLSMMARHSEADVSVIGLVGERGREAREFIEDDLGPDGLARSVVIVATSDESPLLRRQAAYLTMTLCEFFRDQNQDVLCLIDSVTRFAMAQREISLSIGEPPASKGYTPSVFAELPKLLERAGPGLEGQGSVTGLFTVLVDGDDHNEPIADAVRGILDGHVVLDRDIAERGRFPAINILRSLSRTMPNCNSDEENILVTKARRYLSVYDNMAELIRLGAYRKGSNPEVDEALYFYPLLEAFITQNKEEKFDLSECYEQLSQILNGQEDNRHETPV
jgi:flagellum-specific ATP synthase